ncbi:membrane or secreted protein [Novipirellula artificiosorum]|uniref:Uncharacterized protein n=1 Tax=Novipirellula artificiosorum TaxID=2528016 RepID=A0A5C6DT27_9BACT|nr:membrane or secreted protein [Novipirellula artificiosorum]TWU39455.1 hypothetical protein Poly41_22790 [Novipirellula artificiosorum]
MFNFPLIRIVVNLSLIVALTVQPMVALAAEGNCSSGSVCCAAGEKTYQCAGCDCCRVTEPGGLCGCCGGDGEGGCCQSQSNEITDQQPSDCDLAVTVEVIVISTASIEEADAIDGEQAKTKEVAIAPELRSRCLCGQESPPLGSTAPSRPDTQVRNSVAIAFVCTDAFDTSERLSLAIAHRLAGELVPPRFSQRQLCIWRL